MKLQGWVVMLVGMMVFLTLVGFPTPFTDTLGELGITINTTAGNFTADAESSTVWGDIFDTGGLLIALTVTAGLVIIGLFGRGYDPSLVYAGICGLIGFTFIGTFWGLIQYVGSYNQWWLTSMVGLIFGTLAFGFIMAVIDYFGGGR